MEFHEVGRTLLGGLYEETLGSVEFHEVGRNLIPWNIAWSIISSGVVWSRSTLPAGSW